MEDRVWATDWLTTSAQYIYFMDFRRLLGAKSPDRDSKWGRPIPKKDLPEYFYLQPHTRQKKRQDCLICASEAEIISLRFADLLRGFDLGAPEDLGPEQERVELRPVPLFDKDETTKLSDYVFMNVATKKSAIVPERFSGLHGDAGHQVALPYTEDGQLTLEKSVLKGPDIWRDEGISNCIFISDRLKRAIGDAKIKTVKFLSRNLVKVA